MTRPACKLVTGALELDLNDQARYYLHTTFVPPSVALVPLLAGGTSANRAGGAAKVGERAENRAFSFLVNLRGASDAEIRRAAADVAHFLALAGDESNPLYLQFNSNSNTPRVLWGQDGTLRYEIVHGTAQMMDDYLRGNRLASDADLRLDLVLRPYAVGWRQRLSSAISGVIEDTIGAADGQSRGLIVPPSTTQLMLDPSFENGTLSAYWTTDVGAGTGAIMLDSARALFGRQSVKMVKGSVYCNLYQSITTAAATHTITAYVYKEGGGQVTSSDFKFIIDGVAANPAGFISVGSGWYRAHLSVSETAAAHLTGVQCSGESTIWVDGVLFEQRGTYSPFLDGDMLGCAWSGTRFGSTSTRAAARGRVPVADAINRTQGTIRIVWRSDRAQSAYSSDVFLFHIDGSSMRGAFIASTDVWHFHDGTNQINSGAQTFAAGDVLVFHFVYGPSTLKIYLNGVQIATGTSYANNAPTTNAYVGSDNVAANHIMGTFGDFTTWELALTATQIADDYNNVTQVAADGQRVGTIPWLWTKDGDDIVDNHNDAGEDNFGVCAGIAGSAPAITEIRGTLTGPTLITMKSLWLSLLAMDVFFNPDNLYFDLSGTADAGSSGGAYKATTVDTTDVTIHSTSLTDIDFKNLFEGREFYGFFRGRDSAGTAKVQLRFSIGSGIIETEYSAPGIGGAFGLAKTLPLNYPSSFERFGDVGFKQSSILVQMRAKRPTGSSAMDVDYMALMPRPLAQIGEAPISSDGSLIAIGRRASGFASSPNIGEILPMRGDVIELEPSKINVLFLFMGGTQTDPVITWTLTESIYVIPRYALL